ncbi:MAG TPA: response regulator, partial [Bryobacteraceae bacterium]|nr:response regulator [Bryobacteraceae bacterium]
MGDGVRQTERLTILLVDDDHAIRKMLAGALSRRYRVLQASDGLKALELFMREPDAVDLVVSDIRMPTLDGIELVERLRSVRPKLNTLFISGFFEQDERARRMVQPGAAFLAKPFGVRAFMAKDEEMVGGAERADSGNGQGT